MHRLHLSLSRKIKRLAEDSQGIAAVEFALILPLLVTLYFGTVEAATLYAADRKVATVASTMADLVSREKDEISEADALDKYFTAAQTIMRPYATGSLTQVVSLLHIDADTGIATVKWSRAFNGGEERDEDDEFPADATNQKIMELAKTTGDGYLVVSEIRYPYKPVIGLIFSNEITLAHTDYFLPRYQKEIVLKP